MKTYTLIQVKNQTIVSTAVADVTAGLRLNNKNGKAQKANFICEIWAIVQSDGTVLCGS